MQQFVSFYIDIALHKIKVIKAYRNKTNEWHHFFQIEYSKLAGVILNTVMKDGKERKYTDNSALPLALLLCRGMLFGQYVSTVFA